MNCRLLRPVSNVFKTQKFRFSATATTEPEFSSVLGYFKKYRPEIGTAFGMLITAGGLLITATGFVIEFRLSASDVKRNASDADRESKHDAQFRAFESKHDTQFQAFGSKHDAQFKAAESKHDASDIRHDAQFKAFESKHDASFAKLSDQILSLFTQVSTEVKLAEVRSELTATRLLIHEVPKLHSIAKESAGSNSHGNSHGNGNSSDVSPPSIQ